MRLVGFFQITDVFRAQLKGYSVDRAVNMMLLRGADHRGGDFSQQPGQRNFGHGDVYKRQVYAAGAGKVVYVGNQLRGYGNLIMIKHSEDYITAYAHNDKLMVNNGQSVKAGQQIATMGSTDADSVRLHFQIRYRATAIDPLRYLPPQGSKPKC